MISEKIKSIIKNSNISLEIDDENNTISENLFKIKDINNNKGIAEFYLFGHSFTGEVFMNDIDRCYIDFNDNFNVDVNLSDIINYTNMTTDLKILDFFHVRRINAKPKTDIY